MFELLYRLCLIGIVLCSAALVSLRLNTIPEYRRYLRLTLQVLLAIQLGLCLSLGYWSIRHCLGANHASTVDALRRFKEEYLRGPWSLAPDRGPFIRVSPRAPWSA
jgi:hypothetical protein